MDDIKYVCQRCGRKANTKQTTCPECGNKNMNIFVHMIDTIYPRDQLKIKNRGELKRKRKILFEMIIGDDYYKKEEKWNFLYRVINHKDDLYYELIKDGKEIIQYTKEKLSEHWGHGLAKYKNAKNRISS